MPEPEHIPTEPHADMRMMAASLWQMFVALTMEGFSEMQALTIIGQFLAINRPQPE